MGRFIPGRGRNSPRSTDVSDFTVDDAGDFIGMLRRRDRFRSMRREDAWAWIADHLRVPVGSIETLARRRTKRLVDGIGGKLQSLILRELEADMERLAHEFEMARARGGEAARIDVREIEAQMEKTRSLIAEGRGR